MEVTLVRHTPEPDQLSMDAAAICVRGKPSERALRTAIDSGHLSVLEHQSYTFKIEGISRVCLAQLTRHRMASYSVESQRYCDQSQTLMTIPDSVSTEARAQINDIADQAFELYGALIDAGVTQEDARYILPEGTQTCLLMTANARELLHFFGLRCCKRAQREINLLACQMRALTQDVAPITFAHAGPRCQQLGYCPEAHGCGEESSSAE